MDRFVRYAQLVDIVDEEPQAVLMPGMSDSIFHEEFRFSRENAVILLNHLTPHLDTQNNIQESILTTLQWLGTGNYLWNLRGIGQCAKTTVWRRVWSVIDGIVCPEMLRDWLPWPTNNNTHYHVNYFRRKYHLENILGIVDGTHIPILSPSSDPYEAAYVNRKHFHSFNVQVVCGADYKILHADISNVGSTHDARVWGESEIPALIQEANLSLIGDSAYPCRWYLLTPYDAHMRNNLDVRQQTFQRRLLAARQNIEQTIGIVKQRFRILLRPARYSLAKVPNVVLACCVLHNMCRHFKIPTPNVGYPDDGVFDIGADEVDEQRPPDQVGNAVRQDYVNRFIQE